MQRSRSWRRVVKWGLLASAIAITALAAVSARWWIVWNTSDVLIKNRVSLFVGEIEVQHYPTPDFSSGWDFPPGFTASGPMTLTVAARNWTWIPCAAGNTKSFRCVVPLWMPFILTFGPFLYLWHTDRKAAKRARAGACVSCGYDRAGLAAGAACPECGALPKGENAGGGRG